MTRECDVVKRAVVRCAVTRSVAVMAIVMLFAVGCATDGGSSAADGTEPSSPVSTSAPAEAPVPDCTEPESCTTRQLADAAGVTFGTAVTGAYLEEPEYRATLVDTFNSITPENELKWASLQPERGEWDFGPADEIVDFALDHDMAIKGHNLIWDQDLIDSTPDWVLQIDDPDELRRVVTDHISTVMTRYRDSVDRWDVVNEPLETLGAELYDNHFRQVLGDDYLAEVFTIAEAAAPGESLWLNEAAVEFQPAKAAALVALVQDLVERGVPIDGVGLQGHLVVGTVDAVALEQLVADLEALGVDVAITELDVPASDPEDGPGVQAATYRDALGACFAQECREVTLWGFTDRYTWIDETFGEGLAPLPFDEDYRPKPALASIRDQLAGLGG